VLEFGVLNRQVVVTVIVIQISMLPLQTGMTMLSLSLSLSYLELTNITDSKKPNQMLTASQRLQLKKDGPTVGLNL